MATRTAIVVFGCPVGAGGAVSSALARRLVRARVEAEREPDALVIVSGGDAHGNNEAAFMQGWLTAHGVAAGRIRVEPRARDTEENARFCAACLRSAGTRRVLLVTDAFHMRRSRLLLRLALREFGVEAEVVAAPSGHQLGARARWLLGVSESIKLVWSAGQRYWRRRA